MAQPMDKTSRTLKYGSNAVVGVILMIVILSAANYLASRSQVRLDLTRGKQFTISAATRDLLARLPDDVTVTVYATGRDTPSEWTEQRNQLRDLLMEYRVRSRGRVKYTFKDPSDDPAIEREAEQVGVQRQLMAQQTATELSARRGFLGFVVKHKAKSETVPVIQPDYPLEYQLTTAINKVAQVDIPKIGLIAPSGNPFMGDGGNFTLVPQILEQEGYEVKNLEATRLGDLSEISMLMVLDPGELSEEALFRIDQFVMRGGKLFVAASGVNIDLNTGRATARTPNINSILEPYGLKINADMLEDWGRGVQQLFPTPRGFVPLVNPFIAEVPDVDKKSPITANLGGLILYFGSSVAASDHGTSGTLTVLARTSPNTRKQETMFNLEPERLDPPRRGDDSLRAFPIAMQVTGELDSRFATVDPPVLTNDDGSTRTVPVSEVRTKSDPKVMVVVVGSTFSFFNNVLGRQGQINGLFLLNVADVMTRGGELIALRSKFTENPKLRPQIERSEQVTAMFLVVAGVPILLVLFGITKFYMNRMKRRRYEIMYGGAGE